MCSHKCVHSWCSSSIKYLYVLWLGSVYPFGPLSWVANASRCSSVSSKLVTKSESSFGSCESLKLGWEKYVEKGEGLEKLSPRGRKKKGGSGERKLSYRASIRSASKALGLGRSRSFSCRELLVAGVLGVCVFRWFKPEATSLSPLPVEATFRQMRGAPKTRKRLPCGETLGSGNCFFA